MVLFSRKGFSKQKEITLSFSFPNGSMTLYIGGSLMKMRVKPLPLKAGIAMVSSVVVGLFYLLSFLCFPATYV